MHKNNFIFLSINTKIYVLNCYVITLLPVEDLYGFYSCVTHGADVKCLKGFGGKMGRAETGLKFCGLSASAVRITIDCVFCK